jgi:3D (Asp-Asp-Asp) domain-containing protein
VIAADPRVLPVGSIVRILDGPTTGIYTVMDTGSAIKGRRIDVYLPSCAHAKKFGRRMVTAIVIRRGWNPSAAGEP